MDAVRNSCELFSWGMLQGRARYTATLLRDPGYLHDPTLCVRSLATSPRIRIPSHAFNPSKHATDSQPFHARGPTRREGRNEREEVAQRTKLCKLVNKFLSKQTPIYSSPNISKSKIKKIQKPSFSVPPLINERTSQPRDKIRQTQQPFSKKKEEKEEKENIILENSSSPLSSFVLESWRGGWRSQEVLERGVSVPRNTLWPWTRRET